MRSDFSDAEELVSLALQQEREVTEEINALARTAREESDYQGEQFMQWFLAEQVEEVASMNTLLKIVERAKGNLFHVENFLAGSRQARTARVRPHRARQAEPSEQLCWT
ncbi:MAG: ferritin, partial [Sciscionella sp.]